MRRFVNWILFETALGDRLIGLAERRLGIGVLPVETIDEFTVGLLDKVRTIGA